MRELHLSEEESTETFFVLVDGDGVRYQLARREVEPDPAAETDTVDAARAARQPEAVLEAETEAGADSEPEHMPAPQETPQTPHSSPHSSPQPEPVSAALPMRPNEIQARIRAGASPAELAEEMGVPEARVDAYAHPVLLERSQVAEAAKMSHPLREDGPAKLTLFEILASAFAARGHSLHDATWDATRESGDSWVVHLRWSAGLSENEALWSFKRQMGSGATTEARNGVAADLTDPNFVQPVRSLTAVGPGEPAGADEDEHEAAGPLDAGSTKIDDTAEIEQVTEGDFLLHPDAEEAPSKRRRKAVTPHWEDVLLGVRTNPKKPRG